MSKNKLKVIAIDGPSGSGKSTIAKELANRYMLQYLDTGAMYRAISLYLAQDKNIDVKAKYSESEFISALKTLDFHYDFKEGEVQVVINGKDYTPFIRDEQVALLTSHTSKIPMVREFLVKFQQTIGQKRPSVLEGRDIGTVVFPHSDFKFFLTASIESRASRRKNQEKRTESLAQITQALRTRDEQDQGREVSPLKQAEDAELIDTSDLSIEDVINRIVASLKDKNFFS